MQGKTEEVDGRAARGDWWIGLSELQGICRWAGIMGKGRKKLVDGIVRDGAMRSQPIGGKPACHGKKKQEVPPVQDGRSPQSAGVLLKPLFT